MQFQPVRVRASTENIDCHCWAICNETACGLRSKIHYAIGFKNDIGGYELRNPLVKLSSSPKGITTIKNGSETVAVF